jgi:hypothetical protein
VISEPEHSHDAAVQRRGRITALYREHFRSARRERLFWSSVGFLITFAVVRGITHSIRAGVGPFRNIGGGGTHIHHLVFGILLLLGVGYLWLIQVGTGEGGERRRLSVLTALLYGVGAALTLDEVALWLRLEDVYWAREVRASIDAVVLFGALLSVGMWGGPFLHRLARELWRRRT